MQMPSVSSSTRFAIALEFLPGWSDSHRAEECLRNRCSRVGPFGREFAERVLPEFGKHSVQQADGRTYVLSAIVDFLPGDLSGWNVVEFSGNFELAACTFEA